MMKFNLNSNTPWYSSCVVLVVTKMMHQFAHSVSCPSVSQSCSCIKLSPITTLCLPYHLVGVWLGPFPSLLCHFLGHHVHSPKTKMWTDPMTQPTWLTPAPRLTMPVAAVKGGGLQEPVSPSRHKLMDAQPLQAAQCQHFTDQSPAVSICIHPIPFSLFLCQPSSTRQDHKTKSQLCPGVMSFAWGKYCGNDEDGTPHG